MRTAANKEAHNALDFQLAHHGAFVADGVAVNSTIERKYRDENGDVVVEFQMGETPAADRHVTEVRVCSQDGTVQDRTPINITLSAGRSTPVYKYTLVDHPLKDNEKIV